MHIAATRQHSPKTAPAVQRARAAGTRPAAVSYPLLTIARCACGGSCPRCRSRGFSGPAVKVTEPNDPSEREADRLAEQAMRASIIQAPTPKATHVVQRKCAACEAETDLEKLQTKRRPQSGGALSPAPTAPPLVQAVLRSSGRPLEPAVRAYFEPRFGCDFSDVGIHTGGDAAETAAHLDARAYTVGHHIVFGTGEYAPGTGAGRKLLAHELAHVVQQTSAGSNATPREVIHRAPTISVLDENFIGPPSPTQRRAAKSCPITCCDQSLGTLHAMPLFFHQSRGARVAAGSAAATGIGAALHFIASGTQPPAGELCHCDDFRIIQVLETTDPASGRGGNSYVDNSGRNTPFYSDVFLGGRGEHAVPPGYPDAGERLTTTESIYDRPYRDPATLPAANLNWQAESCVACVKNTEPDRVLGCVTYGFTRSYNATTHAFDPVVAVGPGCRSRPSQHFIDTLSHDPTTSTYDFKAAPNFLECASLGDFPLPRGNTRMA